MRRVCILLVIAISGLVSLLSGLACAQSTGPIEFQVDESRWSYRTGAPLQLRLKSICSSLGILTGDLEIQVNDGTNGLIAAVRIPDLVYSAGRQEVEYLLPIQSRPVTNTIGLTFLFREKDGQTRQPTGRVYTSTGLLIPPRSRTFSVPIVRSAAELASAKDDYEWIGLDNHLPKRSDNLKISPVMTLHPRLAAEDMPRDPLKHLVNDIVVIEASGLVELDNAQLQALEAWVKGGGSLFLHLGRELPKSHGEFVDRLLQRTPNLLSDEVEGTNLIPVLRSGALQTLDYGFGRVCVTTERSWSRATERDRRQAFLDLWRLSSEHRQSVLDRGELSLDLLRKELRNEWEGYSSQQRQYDQMYSQIQRRTGQTNAESEQYLLLAQWERKLLSPFSLSPSRMIEALLPRDVRMVPIWLLTFIVLGYIAYIGFGEYIFLGKLKRRRLTWFTFPAITLAITLLTIGTAKGYLGSKVEHTRILIRDVADEGQVCREQRFDLLFRATADTIAIPLKNEVFTPVAKQMPNSRGGYNSSESLDGTIVMFEGVPTGQANAIQTLQQWKPQLNRSVMFPRDQQIPEPIEQLELGKPAASFDSPLTDKVRTASPGVIGFGALTGSGFLTQVAMSDSTDNAVLNSILLMSFRTSGGLFTLFEKISPSADIGMFDLVCGTDEEIRYLATRESGDLVIYRWKVSRNP